MFTDVDSEMQEAITDVSFGVKSITIHQEETQKILRVLTLEDVQYPVTVSERGFTVNFASKEQIGPCTWESLTSLLMEVSPLFVEAFNKKLAAKLSNLSEDIE